MRPELGENIKRCRFAQYSVGAILLLLVCCLYFLDFSTECCLSARLRTTAQKGNLLFVPDRTIEERNSGFLVDTTGCRIPAFDPLDPSIRKFIEKVQPLRCGKKYQPQLVSSNLTSLFMVPAAYPAYNITDGDVLECCYSPFWRAKGDIHNYTFHVDDNITVGEVCYIFQNEIKVNSEFVVAICELNQTEIYRDYFAFTPVKADVEKRCEQLKTDEEDSLSVLVIGLDAVSRLNFHRQMPLTDKLLAELGALEMLGYNKVADNTFPNLVPILTGLFEKELQAKCWPSTKSAFDPCPWLWKNFSDAGFVTGFGEDAPWMGIFNYLKVGFVQQPTDYYMRPYSKLYEDEQGFDHLMNAKLCIGPRMAVEILLEYASKFAKTMTSKRSFGLFWGASLSHDFLNFPQLGDALHADVIRQLVMYGALNRTLLVVMSDHGIRWGAIRETYQGRLEERLPLLFFVFPQWFREKYSEAVGNLRRNMYRLSTPFDLHATLVDILNLPNLQKKMLRQRIYEAKLQPLPRGISLFQPINKNRTCADAGIPPHWCTCQQSEPLAPQSVLARKVAVFLLQHLNDMLMPYRACAELSLLSVHDARVQFPLDHLSNRTNGFVLKDYVLVVETKPGGGVFEATVRQTARNLTVTGTVSRINTYGNQSACVSDYHMKLYCYCVPFNPIKL